MSPTYVPDGGFMAVTDGGPSATRPREWYVWHFTHIDNLPGIVAAGGLHPASAVAPTVDVADPAVKARRRTQVVEPDSDYPDGSVVSDHVPFYFAAKSPMLYVVSRGHQGYRGGTGPLIFLGMTLGDLVSSGLTWCASDRNAAAGLAQFSRDLDGLGTFVDFDLLRQRQWNSTQDDPDRPTRRAAEILVLGELPLNAVTAVVAKTDATLARAKALLTGVGGSRHYWSIPSFYY
ncbi:MAG: type II toxin-antitoxin system toxin DNA ADP-ribosyl transferase DarT [Candidatus Nanopelagicales bacterium]